MIYIALLFVGLFIGSLIMLQCFQGYRLNAKVYKNGLILFLLMACYIAYAYTPTITDDLYRYYKLIDVMRGRSLEWCFFKSSYAHEPFANLLFLLTAKCTENNAIFQTFSVFLIYGLFYYVIKKVTKFIILREENLFIVTFLSFTILLYAISGTRNTLAAMFFACGLYSENDENKTKSYVFYVLSVCTHISLLIIVLLRIMCYLLPKKRVGIWHILLLFWSLGVEIVLNILEKIPYSYIQLIVKKANIYLYERDQEFDSRYLVACLILCITLLIIYIRYYSRENSYMNFVGCLLFFTLGCVFSNVLFERYIRVVIACILPLIMMLRTQKWSIKNIVCLILLVLDVGMFFYQFVMFWSHFSIWFG